MPGLTGFRSHKTAEAKVIRVIMVNDEQGEEDPLPAVPENEQDKGDPQPPPQEVHVCHIHPIMSEVRRIDIDGNGYMETRTLLPVRCARGSCEHHECNCNTSTKYHYSPPAVVTMYGANYPKIIPRVAARATCGAVEANNLDLLTAAADEVAQIDEADRILDQIHRDLEEQEGQEQTQEVSGGTPETPEVTEGRTRQRPRAHNGGARPKSQSHQLPL